MKILIDIPDSFRNSLLEGSLTNDQILDVYRSVRNGVILPKGHGRLIDEKEIGTVVKRVFTGPVNPKTFLNVIRNHCIEAVGIDKSESEE